MGVDGKKLPQERKTCLKMKLASKHSYFIYDKIQTDTNIICNTIT